MVKTIKSNEIKNKNSRVRGHTRRGRFIRSFIRRVRGKSIGKAETNNRSNNNVTSKDKTKKILKNSAIGIASAIGVTAGAYALLKKRYLGNLTKLANNLTPNPNIGKTVNKESLTFAIGGFGIEGMTGAQQSKALKTLLKASLPNSVRKQHEFVDLTHTWHKNTSLKKGKNLSSLTEDIRQLSSQVIRGNNSEVARLAEEIYSWSTKNPDTPINIVGYSAGGNMARDLAYILNKKGINSKTVTLGTTDMKLHDVNKLNIKSVVNPHDTFITATKPRNSFKARDFPKFKDPIMNHRMDTYFTSKKAVSELNKFLYGEDNF